MAQHHQIHGLQPVQPVLPVADLPDTVDGFCRVLGFAVGFGLAGPANYARIKSGDGCWAAPPPM